MTDALTAVRDFYTRLDKGDIDGALAILDPAIEWTEAPRAPYFRGTMRGVQAVIAGLFAPLSRVSARFAPCRWSSSRRTTTSSSSAIMAAW
jgi:ketosteroid isomerase-like protein